METATQNRISREGFAGRDLLEHGRTGFRMRLKKIGFVLFVVYSMGFGTLPLARSAHRFIWDHYPSFRAHTPGPSTIEPVKEREIRHLEFMNWAKVHHCTTVFLGDSITDFWRDRQEVFDANFPDAANFGVGMDRIENVLWRVDAGEIEAVHPKVVVLLIGANNLGSNSEREIIEGIKNLVRTIKTKEPDINIVLVGLLPTDLIGAEPDGPEKVRRINVELAEMKDVIFIDFGPGLLRSDGSFDETKQFDHLHLSPDGYALWAKSVSPVIMTLLHPQS